jgi:AbrB family looped-hinge helix DNA binding protein
MSTQLEPQELQSFRAEPKKTRIEARAVIGDKGRLVIPAAIREAMGFKPGDAVDMHIEDHELRISTRWNRMKRAQERARKLIAPGRSLADELSAERRAEAEAEARQ